MIGAALPAIPLPTTSLTMALTLRASRFPSASENQLSSGTFANGTLDRGFYVLTTNYVNGVPVYWLGERIDNTGNCYYQHVSLIDTGNATTTPGT